MAEREPTEQQKLMLCAETNVVTERQHAGLRHGMGQRMVDFSEYSGRVEEIYLPEDGPIELGADISVVDAERAELEARRAEFQPGLAY